MTDSPSKRMEISLNPSAHSISVSEDFLTLLIDPDKQTYTCLKCGAHGGPEEFYEKYESKKLI